MDEKFYFPSKNLSPVEWKITEEVNFTREDQTINTLILSPEKKAKATVFYFHGAGGNITSYAPLMKPLLEDGFRVIMVDFQGYGKSTGTPTHQNIAADGAYIFEQLLQRPEIGNARILIYGASIGTQIATHLAKKYQSKIEGLVLEGAMMSFGDIAAFYAPEYKNFLENMFVSPYSAKEDVKALSSLPKLFIHSQEDKDVPFIQGQTVYNNAAEPKEFLEFKGEHLLAFKYEKGKILAAMNRMLKTK